MKKIVLSILSFLCAFVIVAQVPQALNYQAVARNNVGQIVPSQNIGVRFTIHDLTATGAIIYQETHTTTTNNFGLFTLAIGKGTVVSGTFNTINWGTGDKYLQVEIAPAGGNNYTVQGTTQFLSVPYSLYSAKTNLIAGNNTVVVANGTTITGNYQAANNTIVVNGNTIAGNYQAGTGISINGNTISATTANNLWATDANGIHNTNANGRVGINRNAHDIYPFVVHQNNTGSGNSIAMFESDDVWQGAVAIMNNVSQHQWTFLVGANAPNYPMTHGSFSLAHGSPVLGTTVISMVVDGTTDFVGIGRRNTVGAPAGSIVPRSTLHLFSGDVYIEQIGSGIIMRSPNGQCWRITIDNSGNLIRTSISCP